MLLCLKFELSPTSGKVAKLEALLEATDEYWKKSYSVEQDRELIDIQFDLKCFICPQIISAGKWSVL